MCFLNMELQRTFRIFNGVSIFLKIINETVVSKQIRPVHNSVTNSTIKCYICRIGRDHVILLLTKWAASFEGHSYMQRAGAYACMMLTE